MKITLEHALNLLLVFLPVPIIGSALHWSPVIIFLSACIAIVPLAGLMGKATEYLADRIGSGWGALLNATFGNACELIIALAALRAGLIDVVEASITGSIIGNILLVLGASMLVGGFRYQTQYFNRTAATTSATLLALAAISLTVPAVFQLANAHGGKVAQPSNYNLALAIAAIQLVTYVLSLIFSLKTHKQLYFSNDGEEKDVALGTSGWGVGKSSAVLLLATIAVAVLSEYLVNAVEQSAEALGLSHIFIGVILVAIVGNAAEHSTAILMAHKNKMDLSINIALGSGSQIALFVAPVIVFVGYFTGHPMDLCFSEVEILSIVVSVIILSFVATDGECNWLEGVQLLAVYCILGAAFFFASH
ncbi:MAG: calcium/proton exchanger [Candidatus Obscuribacter phosphatis]|uniref:Ca(2+)/H(+) antiporter n=1 Tax=Candidatus Obscuribacter phosphatis TaxID=1906157 RepID=A0A8J7TM01_9BACT|nr:calcium/proton exchanger [Candidatus Obscuribacter phosphatis]